MQNEIESKFYPVESELIRTRLRMLGAVCTMPERLMRRVIFDYHTNPVLEKTRIRYIRVRDEGDQVTMSMKDYPRPTEGIKWQREACVTVSSFDDAVAIIKATGLTPNAYQETKRETWRFGEATIEIDTWPGLRPFVEIEVPREELLSQIAHQLELDWDSRMNEAVVALYVRVYQIPKEQVLKLISHVTFESNPFADITPTV